MNTIAIIGAGLTACDYAHEAHNLGIRTICFAWEKDALAKDCVDTFYPISIFEKEKILEICKANKICGVLATTELTIEIAAYIADRLKLRGIDYACSREITNKERNRKLVENIPDLNQPWYELVDIQKNELLLEDRFPIIVKPVSRGGKRGVSVAYNNEELRHAIEYAREFSRDQKHVLLEEYIYGGIECSVETLSYNKHHYVVQITEKISSGPPHCVELGHHQPARITENIKERIIKLIPKALDAICLDNSPCHTEIKIVDGKIYLIEFNARPGGDFISHPLVKLSTGYSYLGGAIRIALDQDPQIKLGQNQRYAGVCFVCEQTKDLIPLFDECEKHDWCYKKNATNEEYSELRYNNPLETNYFIYAANKRPSFV